MYPKQWPERGGSISRDGTKDLSEHPGGTTRSECLRVRGAAPTLATIANLAEQRGYGRQGSVLVLDGCAAPYLYTQP